MAPLSKVRIAVRDVLVFETAHGRGGNSPHGFDLATEMAQQVDIVNQVDRDRTCALARPPGSGVEIVVGLVEPATCLHRAKNPAHCAAVERGLGRLHHTIVPTVMADKDWDIRGCRGIREGTCLRHRDGDRLLDENWAPVLDTGQPPCWRCSGVGVARTTPSGIRRSNKSSRVSNTSTPDPSADPRPSSCGSTTAQSRISGARCSTSACRRPIRP